MSKSAGYILDAISAQAFARLEAQAHEAATSPWNHRKHPTAANFRAANWKHGQFELRPGMRVKIENARGTIRSGTAPDGTQWENRMAAHYGDIIGTRGADGDPVDIFLGPFPESSRVWVINQRGPAGFDEHKVMAGFHTEEAARAAYLGSYDRGWDGLESIVPCTYAQLRWWLRNGDTSARFTTDNIPQEGTAIMDKAVLWDADANPVGRQMHELVYALRREDAGEGLLLDAATMADLMTDPDIEATVTLDALVVEVSRMSPKMDMLKRVMESAGNAVKPTEVTISDPVRARGVLQVMVLFQMSDGQTISVWFHNPDTTPAKLTPLDELISWKWMLNKKDVTIVVAPERGQELNIREVARRVMRLVERNSDTFKRANAKSAEKVKVVEGLKAEIAVLEVELSDWQRKIERAQLERDEAPTPKERWDSARGHASAVDKQVREEVIAGRFPQDPSALADITRMLGELRELASGATQVETPEALRAQVDELAVAIRARAAEAAQAPAPAPVAEAPAAPAPAPAASDSILAGLGLSAEDIAAMADDGGYAAIVANEKLALKWQDALDSAMAQRAVDVRNALRQHGWKGTGVGLSKEIGGSVYGVESDATLVGAGRNAVQLFWVVNQHERIVDDLTMKAPEMALRIDAAASAQAASTPAAETITVAPDATGYFWSIYRDGDGRDGKGAQGRWGSLAAAKDALDNMDNGGGNFYGVDEKTRDLFWSFKAETAILAANGRVPEPEQQIRLMDDARRWGNKERDEYGWAWMVRNLPKWIVLRTGMSLPNAQELVRQWSETGAPADPDTPARIAGAPATAAQLGVSVAPEMMGELPAGFTEGPSGIATNPDPVTGGIIDKQIASGKWFVIFNNDTIPKSETVFDTRAEAIEHFNVMQQQLGPKAPEPDLPVQTGSPSDAALQAAAESGAEVNRVARNLANPDTKDLPKATLSGGTAETIFLYTDADVARAVKAVHEAEDLMNYKAFDPASLKLPTAVQLGLNKRNVPTVIVSNDLGTVLDGWSNGHMIDLVGRPGFINKAFDKYAALARRVPISAVEKIEAKAKGRGTQVAPIARYDFEEVSNEAGKPMQRIPRESLVLESADGNVWVWLDERYVAYFWKTFKGCEFFADGPDESVAVRHHGKLVGIIMPRNGAKDGKLLANARRAKAKAEVAAQDPDALSVAQVDAAYQFADATQAFKLAIAHSVGESQYSAFLTARGMDERAKALGLTISWDVQEVALDSTAAPTLFEEESDAAVLDAVAELARAYLPAEVVLDFAGDVSAAISQLEIALDVCVTNEPINRARGDVDQADLEASNASQFRRAIEVLRGGSEVLDAVKDPLMVRITSGGKTIGTMTPAEFMKAAKAPSGTFLPAAIKKFNEWKESIGEPERAEQFLVGGKKVLDDAGEEPAGEVFETCVGTIKRNSEVIGRAVVSDGDGKAMVYLGASGKTRVQWVSGTGERRDAMWSDDDAVDMIDWLVENLAHAAQPAATTEDEEDPNIGRVWRSTSGVREITGFADGRYTTTLDEEPGLSISPDDLEQEIRDDERAVAEVEAETIKARADVPELIAAGFKRVGGSGQEYAKSVDVDARATLRLNIKRVGGNGYPVGWVARKSTTFKDGVTGTPSQELGKFETPTEALAAVEAEIAKRLPAAAPDGENAAMNELRPLQPQTPDRAAWEGEIARLLVEQEEIPNGDAQGMMEAHPDDLDAAFARGDAPAAVVAALWPVQAAEPAAPAEPKGDISYREKDDMFTAFYPDSKAGEAAWAVINATPGSENGVVLTTHAASVIEQLQAAGYTVTRAAAPDVSDDELAAELAAPVADPAKAADRTYLGTLIDGTADIFDEGILPRIEAMYEKYASDAEMMSAIEQAANAWSNAAAAAAKQALGA